MSTRQNKKQRKGRNNANNRERTVTTLTEDPNTPYLVPTPSEEPAGIHMSQPFPGNSGGASGKLHNMPMVSPSYNNFGFAYSPSYSMQNMHQQQQQQQPFFSPSSQHHIQQPQHETPDVRPKIQLPPGKNDLEILQNLKRIIKENQHPFYKAIPSPAALASFYKGTIAPQPRGTEYRNDSADVKPPPASPSTGFSQSAGDRRQQRIPPGKDRRGPTGNNNSGQGNGNHYSNPPSGSVANLNITNLKISKHSSGSPTSGVQPEPRFSDVSLPTGPSVDQDILDEQRPGRYDYSVRSRFPKNDFVMNDQPGDSVYDNPPKDALMDGQGSVYVGKDDISRSGGWAPRDTAHPDRGYDSERNTTPRPQAAGGVADVDSRPLVPVDRGTGSSLDAHDRDGDRPQRGDWHDRDHRVVHDRGRDPRLTDSRRSSSAAEQRPSGVEYGHHSPVRRGPTESPVLMNTLPQMPEAPPSSSDVEIRPPVDSRPQPDTRAEPHSAAARSADRLGPDTEDIQSSRSSSVRPPDVPVPLDSAEPAAPGDDLVGDPSMHPPLKDRTIPSRHPGTSNEVSTGPSEQPLPQQQQHQAHPQDHPPPPASAVQDRYRKPINNFQKDRAAYNRPTYDGPPKTGDSYRRPSSPSGPPPISGGGGGPPPHRAFNPRSSGSVDDRPKMPPSPASRGSREFRGPGPNRDISRDRGSYRPDFHDRYGVDPEGPRYEGRPYRDFSPPPPMSGGRGPPPPDAPPMPPSARGDYYPQGRREWVPVVDDDYYKSRAWEAPPPPPPSGERGRYERDYPPPRSAGWDRPDREFVARDGYPSVPPGPPIDDRYPHGPPPMRDADRGRPLPPGYNPPPYNRVRPRSPSPMRRPGPLDDPRPPMKRPREDFPPEYYPGSSGGVRDNLRRPSSDYPAHPHPHPHPPPRTVTPGGAGPPPNSGWAPPSSASSNGTMGAGPPPPLGDRDRDRERERDYRMGRDSMDYGHAHGPPGVGGYDRPRSPGPPLGGRIPYNRGGYGRGNGGDRDRGGYGMQRP